MLPQEQGGEAPDGKDFNGLFNLMSQFYYDTQNGGTYTFVPEVSDAIGGYPENALLWYFPQEGTAQWLRSTKPSNTDNFIANPEVIGTSWVKENTEGSTFPLFMSFKTCHILNNASYVNGRLFSWLSGAVYTSAYNEFVNEKNHAATEQKAQTISGVEITYYLTPDKYKICLPDQADNVAALYTATGAADFYLLDTENQQFKLPRRNARRLLRAYKSSTDWYNLYSDGWVEQGGTSLIRINENVVFPLSFVNTDYTLTALPIEMIPNVGSNDISYKTKSNASIRLILRFNGAAQSGFNCMWQASGYAETSLIQDEFEYEYFFVGNTVQNQTSIDVGQITQTLTGKADVDLSNAVPAKSFTSQSAGWAMPSDSYVDLTLGASGSTYTAPANGYFAFEGHVTSSNGWCNIFVMNNDTTFYSTTTVGPNVYHWTGSNIPVHKDAIVKLSWANYSMGFFRFIYAQGEI